MIALLTECTPRMIAIEKASHVMPWSVTTLNSCFQDGYHVYGWHADDEPGELLGFYIASHVGDELTLMNIAVHPERQSRGIGRSLMQHLLSLANQNGASIWLEVRQSNQSARALYSSLGFSEVGCRPNYYPLDDGREDAIVMHKAQQS